MLASLALFVAATGYAAADVLDVAPGILTLDRPVAVPTPTVSGTPAPVLLPEPAASVDPLLTDTGAAAPIPTSEGLAAALGAASKDPALDGGIGVSIRDGISGEELWALDAERAPGAGLHRQAARSARRRRRCRPRRHDGDARRGDRGVHRPRPGRAR